MAKVPGKKSVQVTSKPVTNSAKAGVAKTPTPATWPAWWEKKSLYVIIVIALITLVLRLQNLGYLSFWVDEYWHAGRTKAFLAGGPFKDLFAVETNGAVVTILSVISGAIFGQSEFTLRLPIVLGSIALLPLVYFFLRKNVNASVAVIATMILALSPFLFFWSRLCRMYGLVPTTFFALVVAFVAFYENGSVKGSILKTDNNTISSLRWKIMPALLAVFLVSFFTSQISFLFFFSMGLYAILMTIQRYGISKVRPFQWNDKYVLVSLVSVPVFILSFSPLNKLIARPIFLKLMPVNLVDKILPDMTAIGQLLDSEDKWRVFKTFFAVLQTDFPILYLFGFVGIVTAYRYGVKLGHLWMSFFVFPFFLLGFVFINMNLAKYMTFIYPLFVVSMAIGLYSMIDIALTLIQKNETNISFTIKILVPVLVILALAPFKTIKSLAFEKKHGSIIDSKLAEWFFTNWKDPMNFIKSQPGFNKDLLVSTMPEAVSYYSGAKNVLFFRQNYYDVYQKGYLPNKPSGSTNSAASYEDFVATFNAHEKGWLVADYYLYNAMTDPRARNFVFENMEFHPEACEDGSVQLFSWDKSKPRTQPGNIVIELGKPLGKQMSDPLVFGIQNTAMVPSFKLEIISKGINAPNEAFVSINGTQFVPIPQAIVTDPLGYGKSVVLIDKSTLQNGQNQIVFAYNPDSFDIQKGFVVYNIGFGY
jgi:hypothetical protein